MKQFIFEKYDFDATTGQATFEYSFDGEIVATERIAFPKTIVKIDQSLLDAALRHAFLILGISYYNAFPSAEIVVRPFELSQTQADYLNSVYRNGLGEFWYVNKLSPDVFTGFSAMLGEAPKPIAYDKTGLLLLSSGGKDSLLSGLMLEAAGKSFTSLFVTNDGRYPHMLDTVTGQPPLLLRRELDLNARKELTERGGLSGHVPFTAIIASISLVAAILNGDNVVVISDESSSNEGTAMIGDFVANHAWSKSYEYELMLQDYIHTFISPDLHYVSLIRQYTDLHIAELFVKNGWARFGSSFSSCNLANYKQGQQAEVLRWCGNCDKCANAWLTFAPFLDPEVLEGLFGRNLIQDPAMKQRFLNLLGLGEHKPFECVGTIDELRTAYHIASQKNAAYAIQGVTVPTTQNYDYHHLDTQQQLASDLLS